MFRAVGRLPHSKRRLWALGLSLLLHAILIAWWFSLSSSRTSVPQTSNTVVQMEVWERPTPPPLRETPVAPETVAAPIRDARPSRPAGPAKATQVSGEPSAPPADSPREMSLLPSDEVVSKMMGTVEVEPSRGHTVQNSEQERPDPLALRDYTREKLGRRMGALVEGMVARVKAGNGLVDPYFSRARSELEGELSSGDVPLPKGAAAREFLKGVGQLQQQFGKTGSPFAAGEEPNMSDFAIARSETNGSALQLHDAESGGSTRQLQQSMISNSAAGKVLDHAWVEAIIELVQEAGGGIADAHVVKSSGSKDFDEYVLHRARKVFLRLEEPPTSGQGISADGWRTFWKFSYFPASIVEQRGQRVRVELLRVEKGPGSGLPNDSWER